MLAEAVFALFVALLATRLADQCPGLPGPPQVQVSMVPLHFGQRGSISDHPLVRDSRPIVAELRHRSRRAEVPAQLPYFTQSSSIVRLPFGWSAKTGARVCFSVVTLVVLM